MLLLGSQSRVPRVRLGRRRLRETRVPGYGLTASTSDVERNLRMAKLGIDVPSLKGRVSPEEWAVRVDLAAAYRLVSLFGWEDLVFTHISMRVPGTEDQFLINPYGVFFDEITASSLVKIDLNGDKVQDSPFPVNAAGFIIHSAIHSARHDARCVLHTHTVNGVAVAAQR